MVDFDFDLNDMDIDGIDRGFSIPKPGKYHVRVTAVQYQEAPDPAIVATVEILAGTVAGQEGKTQRIWLNLSGDTPEHKQQATKRSLLFAIACGLTTSDEAKKAQAAKRPLKINFDLAVGRTLYVEIVEYQKSDGTPGVKIGWGMWPLTSPKVAGLPVHPAYADSNTKSASSPTGGVYDSVPEDDCPF